MNEELAQAEKNLDDFLNENPHMRKNQEVLDKLMNKVPEKDRLTVISVLLAASLQSLSETLSSLLENIK